jgi:N-acetylmuramoyl-L-alanine amidase
LLVAAAPLPALAERGPDLKILVDETVHRVPTDIRDATTYVPIRYLADVFGAEIVRDSLSDSQTFLLGENRIELAGEGNLLSVNGEVRALSAPVLSIGEDRWVPFDFVLSVIRPLYDKGMVWSAEDRTLFITHDKPLGVDLDVSFSEQGARAAIAFSRKVVYSLESDGRRLKIRFSAQEIQIPFTRRDYDESSLKKVRFYRTAEGGQITLQAGKGFENWNHRVEESPYRLVIDVTRGGELLLADDQLQAQSPIRERAAPEQTPLPDINPPTPQGAAIRDNRWTVVIDPGHGGEETGAAGVDSGLLEKDLVLDVGLRLRRLLQRDPSLRVILTREADVALGLGDRTAQANHHRADLFISIHANASDWPEAHGAETYFLSPSASDDEARRTAALENDALGFGDTTDRPDEGLQMILWDLAQVEFLEESSELAESIQDELNRVLRIENRGIKQAPFRVLTGATMPAVLVEIGFLSNPDEERLFLQSDYKDRIAGALDRSIREFRHEVELRTRGGELGRSIGSPGGP